MKTLQHTYLSILVQLLDMYVTMYKLLCTIESTKMPRTVGSTRLWYIDIT